MNNLLPITLTSDELQALTGYTKVGKQLMTLHQRGFTRAFIGRAGLVLERSHYEAISTTNYGATAASPRRSANIDFLRTP